MVVVGVGTVLKVLRAVIVGARVGGTRRVLAMGGRRPFIERSAVVERLVAGGDAAVVGALVYGTRRHSLRRIRPRGRREASAEPITQIKVGELLVMARIKARLRRIRAGVISAGDTPHEIRINARESYGHEHRVLR